MWSPVRKKRWVSSLMGSINFKEYYSNLLSQTENIFHLFRPGLIMPLKGGKFARLLAPENRRVNIPSNLSVYYLTYDIFCHYRLKWKKIRVEILWRTVSLLPALSKSNVAGFGNYFGVCQKVADVPAGFTGYEWTEAVPAKKKMQIKKYLDTSRRGLICFQKYKILTEARLTVALKNCGQFKIFPQIIKIFLRISYNRLSRLPYLGALSICQNWPASRLDYQPLFGKMSPHSFPRKRMRIKDRTRETAEIEPNRPDHSCDSVELRILLWLSSQIINIMQEEMVFQQNVFNWPASSDFWKPP